MIRNILVKERFSVNVGGFYGYGLVIRSGVEGGG
jgi:hypothetical protein